jgi:hypothetical protein
MIIVYRLPEFLCCRMIWGHPPLQASVGELYIKGVERQRGGGGAIFAIFTWERECGPVRDPNHTTAQKLWYSTYYTPFTRV